MEKNYAEFIIQHKVLTIILSILMVMSMGFGAQFLTFTNDYRIFFGEDNPQLLAFEELQDTYSKNDNVMFLLVPEDGKVFSNRTLEAVAWLTERAWETPHSSRVESLTNYQHTSAVGDDLLVEDLAFEPGNMSDAELAKIRKIALDEPVLINRLISPKAHVTGVNITIELPGVDPIVENPQVVDFIRDLREEFRQMFPGIEVAAERSWAGYIDSTPDQAPVLGAVDGRPGLYIVTGLSGHGFALGPGAARLLAKLIVGEKPLVDPRPFRYSRFAENDLPSIARHRR